MVEFICFTQTEFVSALPIVEMVLSCFIEVFSVEIFGAHLGMPNKAFCERVIVLIETFAFRVTRFATMYVRSVYSQFIDANSVWNVPGAAFSIIF